MRKIKRKIPVGGYRGETYIMCSACDARIESGRFCEGHRPRFMIEPREVLDASIAGWDRGGGSEPPPSHSEREFFDLKRRLTEISKKQDPEGRHLLKNTLWLAKK